MVGVDICWLKNILIFFSYFTSTNVLDMALSLNVSAHVPLSFQGDIHLLVQCDGHVLHDTRDEVVKVYCHGHVSAMHEQPRKQSSWGQHGAHLGPLGPRWAPCWPHEPCYHGGQIDMPMFKSSLCKHASGGLDHMNKYWSLPNQRPCFFFSAWILKIPSTPK